MLPYFQRFVPVDFYQVMSTSPNLYTLSNELLKDVVDFLDADPDRSINIDRRAYLSVESFRPPSPPVPSRAQDVGNFRLVCRRFAEIGIPYQFTKIATRFSPHGLERLDKISSQSHLAKHTRKFSYLVPYFYIEGKGAASSLKDAPFVDMSKVESTSNDS